MQKTSAGTHRRVPHAVFCGGRTQHHPLSAPIAKNRMGNASLVHTRRVPHADAPTTSRSACERHGMHMARSDPGVAGRGARRARWAPRFSRYCPICVRYGPVLSDQCPIYVRLMSDCVSDHVRKPCPVSVRNVRQCPINCPECPTTAQARRSA